MAGPIEMLFGRQLAQGTMYEIRDGTDRLQTAFIDIGYIGTIWRIGRIDLCGSSDAGCHCHYCSNLLRIFTNRPCLV